jgi:hypothetical protein
MTREIRMDQEVTGRAARRSCVAVIVGISGAERYLKGSEEVTQRERAQRFRSPASAEAAAKRVVDAQPDVIRRHMAYRVEPLA